MLTTSQMIITVLVAGVTTFATRLIPFAAFGNREVPKIIRYLGDIMPSALSVFLLYIA